MQEKTQRQETLNMVKRRGCKYGKLKKPYRDSKGRMRRCKSKRKR